VVGASHKVPFAKELGCDVVIDKSTQQLWPEAEAAAPAGSVWWLGRIHYECVRLLVCSLYANKAVYAIICTAAESLYYFLGC
jgi:hypothetical protein